MFFLALQLSSRFMLWPSTGLWKCYLFHSYAYVGNIFLGVHTANRPMLKVGGTVFKTVALRTQSHKIVCSLGFNTDTRCHLDSTLGGLCMKWNPSPYAMIEVDWLESWQFLMTEWSRLRYSRSPKKVIQTAFMRHPRRLCTGRFTTLCY